MAVNQVLRKANFDYLKNFLKIQDGNQLDTKK